MEARKALLVCGILSSLLYGVMIGAIGAEGYSRISQTPSELTAIGAPTRSLWMQLGAIYTVLVTAFGWGVWKSAGRDRALRLVGGLLVAYGSLGLLWPFAPMHQREVLAAGGGTLSDAMHIVLASATVLLMFVAIGVAARAFGKRFRLYSIASIVVLVAFGALTFWDAPRVQANLPTPWTGLWERINISVFLLWVVVLATVLLRGGSGRSGQPGAMKAGCAGGSTRKKGVMSIVKAFITRHPVRTYFAFAFAGSWAGVLFVVGPGGIPTTIEHLMTIGPAMYVAMLAGPSVAGLLMTSLVSGRAGLREVLARLLMWRVGGRWYAAALLTAPFLVMAVSLALSLLSPEFLPAVFMTNDKAPLPLFGLAGGLIVGIFEELGWTGFAIPRMRQRYGVLSTGLLVGVLWGAWHFIMFWEPGSFSGALPLALLLVKLFSWLPAYRVLMVWVYDRTGSLLVAMLMHGSLTATQLILMPLPASGMSVLTSILALAAAYWLVVAIIAVANGGQFSRPMLWRRVA